MLSVGAENPLVLIFVLCDSWDEALSFSMRSHSIFLRSFGMRRAIGTKTTCMTGVLRKTARCLAGIVGVAAIGLSSPGLAKADLYTGYLFLNTTAGADATVSQFSALGGASAAVITFTTNAINFDDTTPQSTATVQQFFNSNSSAVTVLTGSSHLSDILTTAGIIQSGGYILFTGSTFLNAGTTSYSVNHDDGAELQVNGQTAFSSPGPTTQITSTGSVTAGSAGNYTFNLAFGEVNGTPAVIQFSPALPTPEPSTLAIGGVGALGMIGYGLRRRKAKGA
jgi:hypothetical protein